MNLSINDFEGPLDLLLHLVKTAKMDIYNIDIKIIIDSYLSFINTLDKKNLDDASEYLVMAAELIHLKSKLLINSNIQESSDYEINSEEDLKNKLIEYEKYKNISTEFKIFEENRKEFYTSSPQNLSEYMVKRELSPDTSIDDLVSAFLELKKRVNFNKPVSTRITRKELSVDDKKKYINNLLNVRKEVEFSELFVDNTKGELVVTFLAILTLSKEQVVNIKQSKNFDKIMIEVINNG
ncbi:MAG: segregation/condensation protein A [bacterium]